MRSTLDLLHALRDLRDDRLAAPHRLVLALMLAHRHGDDPKTQAHLRGACDPSNRQLVASTGLGESTIHRLLVQLRGWGYLSLRRPGHHHAAPVHDVHLPEKGSRSETSRNETSRSESQGSRSESDGVSLRESGVSQRDLLRISSADRSADQPVDRTASPSAPVAATAPTTAPEPLELVVDEKPTGHQTQVDVARVWNAYLALWRRNLGFGHEPKLSSPRRAQIQARLRAGYTFERITRAFEGLFASPHHRGENDTRTKYLEIEQVIRADQRVEKFEGMTNTIGPAPVRRSTNAAIKQAAAPAELAPWRTAGAS